MELAHKEIVMLMFLESAQTLLLGAKHIKLHCKHTQVIFNDETKHPITPLIYISRSIVAQVHQCVDNGLLQFLEN